MPNFDDIATCAKDKADKLGIKKFDIYGATIDENSVQVERGSPKQVKASNRSSVTVRVWNEHNTVGITSTTDVEPAGVEVALKTAYEASFLVSRNMFLILARRLLLQSKIYLMKQHHKLQFQS